MKRSIGTNTDIDTRNVAQKLVHDIYNDVDFNINLVKNTIDKERIIGEWNIKNIGNNELKILLADYITGKSLLDVINWIDKNFEYEYSVIDTQSIDNESEKLDIINKFPFFNLLITSKINYEIIKIHSEFVHESKIINDITFYICFLIKYNLFVPFREIYNITQFIIDYKYKMLNITYQLDLQMDIITIISFIVKYNQIHFFKIINIDMILKNSDIKIRLLDNIAIYAVNYQNLYFLHFLKSNNYTFTEKMLLKTIKKSYNIKCFIFIHQQLNKFPDNILSNIILNGTSKQLEYILNNGININNVKEDDIINLLQNEAYQDTDIITRLFRRGFKFGKYLKYAIYSENIDVIDCLIKLDSGFKQYACVYAAINGNVDILRNLCENGLKITEIVCVAAVLHNNFGCLKFISERGYNFNTKTLIAALYNLNIDILIYVKQNCKSMLNYKICKKHILYIANKHDNQTRFNTEQCNLFFDYAHKFNLISNSCSHCIGDVCIKYNCPYDFIEEFL